MVRPHSPIALAFTLALFNLFSQLTARAEEWQITYAVTQEQITGDPKGVAAPKKEEHSYTLTVALGQLYFAVDHGHARTIYDFTRRRILQLNLAKNEYEDWSLYSNIAARVREMENRYTMGAASKEAGVDTHSYYERFATETSLGIALPGIGQDELKPVITRKDLPDGGWDFWHDGQSVAQFIPAKTVLPALFSIRFGSFLAYECNLHPEIRRQLIATNGIPQLLVAHWAILNQQNTATYRLQSVKQPATDSAVIPSRFKPASHQEGGANEPILHVIGLIHDRPGPEQRTLRETTERFAREAISDKRPLDAYLAFLEYRLESGERHSKDFLQYQQQFAQDKRCQQYVISLDQSTQDDCRKGLASCDSIDRRGLQKAYMIDLQRADLLQRLGQGHGGMTTVDEQKQIMAAESLFLKVVTANPYLAGAYHDLGGLYDRTYRQALAWVCFDTGRQLSPDHFLFKDITVFEQRLEHDFPDYF